MLQNLWVLVFKPTCGHSSGLLRLLTSETFGFYHWEINCCHFLQIKMWCTIRKLTLASLLIGSTATGTLSLAVAVDYWLFTSEPVPYVFNGTTIDTMATFHSGLWRTCPIFEGRSEFKLQYALIILSYRNTSSINFFLSEWHHFISFQQNNPVEFIDGGILFR